MGIPTKIGNQNLITTKIPYSVRVLKHYPTFKPLPSLAGC